MTLSVCMIVRDEEQTLARCLNCITPFTDEIIIVDTGSRDSTPQIAKNYTDKVFTFEWCDDFSAARNFSFSKATCDYVMWLDADDVIDSENAQKILALKQQADFDVAFLKYAAAFIDGKPTFVYFRERILRRSMNFLWKGAVHEAITPRGKIIYSDACIFHRKVKSGDAMRNLRIYMGIVSRGGKLDARGKFYYGRELFFNGFYVESCAVLNDFIRGDGWIENKIEACRTLIAAYGKLNMTAEAERVLSFCLTLSYPRAQECCSLGLLFERKGDLHSAAYWYERALASAENLEGGGFINPDYSGYLPAIRLCVVYDKMGDWVKAESYNELAGTFRPNDKSYLHNREYFNNKLARGN